MLKPGTGFALRLAAARLGFLTLAWLGFQLAALVVAGGFVLLQVPAAAWLEPLALIRGLFVETGPVGLAVGLPLVLALRLEREREAGETRALAAQGAGPWLLAGAMLPALLPFVLLDRTWVEVARPAARQAWARLAQDPSALLAAAAPGDLDVLAARSGLAFGFARAEAGGLAELSWWLGADGGSTPTCGWAARLEREDDGFVLVDGRLFGPDLDAGGLGFARLPFALLAGRPDLPVPALSAEVLAGRDDAEARVEQARRAAAAPALALALLVVLLLLGRLVEPGPAARLTAFVVPPVLALTGPMIAAPVLLTTLTILGALWVWRLR